ncbi:hypothetical protein F8388_008612 [Cannabis sativa]|uniref:Ribosome assembly factor mrt4 n=1 Tax=Cannabis sativa TaxID=3483 RepID=A0A7J6I0H4_CANSA|nr:hypothetical protein F8388_008612 [Cannabis sativa]KAF4400599.1 hypothetical protein G4B88_023392 [Cannabis sativa]
MGSSESHNQLNQSINQKNQIESFFDFFFRLIDSISPIMYVFSSENMRNLKFKQFREQLKANSRFFLGSNKVMQVALGRSASDEIIPNIYKVSKLLRGDAGLLCTNLPKEEVERIFNEYEDYDFARTGSLAIETVELKEDFSNI